MAGRGFSSGSSGRGFSTTNVSRGVSTSSGGARGGHRSMGPSHYRSRHTVVFYGNGNNYNGTGGKAIMMVMGLIFAMIGILVLISGFSDLGKPEYKAVNAEIVSDREVGGFYYTSYEYSVNGTMYFNESQEGWSKESLGAGVIVTIYYNVDNPNEIWEEKPSGRDGAVFEIVVGSVFILVGGLLFVLGVKMKTKNENDSKQNSSTQSAESTESETGKTVESSKYCPYCGTKYDSSKNKCSSCGARLK